VSQYYTRITHVLAIALTTPKKLLRKLVRLVGVSRLLSNPSINFRSSLNPNDLAQIDEGTSDAARACDEQNGASEVGESLILCGSRGPALLCRTNNPPASTKTYSDRSFSV